jgi:hypothetical protein
MCNGEPGVFATNVFSVVSARAGATVRHSTLSSVLMNK